MLDRIQIWIQILIRSSRQRKKTKKPFDVKLISIIIFAQCSLSWIYFK